MLHIYIYIYDISSLRFNNLTFIPLTWRKWLALNNASRQQMGFNSGFKGLKPDEMLDICVIFSVKHSMLIQYVFGQGRMKECQFLGKEKVTFLVAKVEGVTP